MNKSKFSVLLAIVVFASCSAPKYTSTFGQDDSYAGKKPKGHNATSTPLSIDPEMLTASASAQPIVLAESPVKKTYMQMNRIERKMLRHQLKKDIKTYLSAKKKNHGVESATAKQGIDGDLKLAAIFGAVGIVALIIGTDVFNIIGGIALLIGVVFFVKWLIRQ